MSPFKWPRWDDHGYATNLHLQFAIHVRATLFAEGKSQAWLAAETGLTEKHVSMVLSGLSDGSFETWERFATALGDEWVIDLEPPAAPFPCNGGETPGTQEGRQGAELETGRAGAPS